MSDPCRAIVAHYLSVWRSAPRTVPCGYGRISDLPTGFQILEFEPSVTRSMWTYATCGMSIGNSEHPLELHLFSPRQESAHAELLTAVAHYHCTGQPLGAGHTVNFGRPWIDRSECNHGLISLPYLDGPALERFADVQSQLEVRFLWLIPITKAEVEFKKLNGLEALESRLEEAHFDYLNPRRPSIV